MSLSVVPNTSNSSLSELVARANDYHARIQLRGKAIVEDAIICGTALNQIKGQLEPGMWIYWFHQHFTMHITTAQRYMRIAEHAEMVRAHNAVGIADAMRILEDEPRLGKGPVKYGPEEIAEMIDLANRIGVKPAARELEVSPATIHKYVATHQAPEQRPTRKTSLNQKAVERVAVWLCDHITSYPAVPNFKVRRDAEEILKAARGD